MNSQLLLAKVLLAILKVARQLFRYVLYVLFAIVLTLLTTGGVVFVYYALSTLF